MHRMFETFAFLLFRKFKIQRDVYLKFDSYIKLVLSNFIDSDIQLLLSFEIYRYLFKSVVIEIYFDSLRICKNFANS